MNVIEATDFYLRVIKLDFVSRDSEIQLRFRIVPVCHIGSEKFYKGVFDQLNACDEVIFEGLAYKKATRITRYYANMARKLDLVLQREALCMRNLKPKLIHADFDRHKGAEEWEKLRFTEKVKFRYIYPARMLWRSREMTRRKLVKEFMASSEEAWLAYGPLENEPGSMWNYIIAARDEVLLNVVKNKIKKDGRENKRVGIVYGAAHMKPVIRLLIDQFKYVPEHPEFLEVFEVR